MSTGSCRMSASLHPDAYEASHIGPGQSRLGYLRSTERGGIDSTRRKSRVQRSWAAIGRSDVRVGRSARGLDAMRAAPSVSPAFAAGVAKISAMARGKLGLRMGDRGERGGLMVRHGVVPPVHPWRRGERRPTRGFCATGSILVPQWGCEALPKGSGFRIWCPGDSCVKACRMGGCVPSFTPFNRPASLGEGSSHPSGMEIAIFLHTHLALCAGGRMMAVFRFQQRCKSMPKTESDEDVGADRRSSCARLSQASMAVG